MPFDSIYKENTYVLDSEDMTETIRLSFQDGLLLQAMGGPIPEQTEWEYSSANSSALERLKTLFIQALDASGRSFSPDASYLGIAPLLGPFLKQAGYQNIKTMPHTIDWSYGTAIHEGWHQNSIVLLQTARSFILQTGEISPEEYDALHQQALIDTLADDFRGMLFLLTAWGEKG